MKLNAPLRRTVAAAAGALIGLAGAVAFAAPANAHHPIVSPGSRCVYSDGSWQVDWHVLNSEPDIPGKIIELVTEPDVPIDGIAVGSVFPVRRDGIIRGTQHLGADVEVSTVKIKGEWVRNGQLVFNASFEDESIGTLEKPKKKCDGPPPPPKSPSPSPSVTSDGPPVTASPDPSASPSPSPSVTSDGPPVTASPDPSASPSPSPSVTSDGPPVTASPDPSPSPSPSPSVTSDGPPVTASPDPSPSASSPVLPSASASVRPSASAPVLPTPSGPVRPSGSAPVPPSGSQPPVPTVPEEDPGAPTPIIEGDCTSLTIGLDNPAEGLPITLGFRTSEGEVRTLQIAPGERKTETFDATTGFAVTITLTVEGDSASETVKFRQPAECAPGGGGGDLALTGAAAGSIAGGAGVLLALGALMFFLARRRKVRFTA